MRVGRAPTSPPAARCLELETSLGGEGSLLERASTSFSARDVARVAHRASPAEPARDRDRACALDRGAACVDLRGVCERARGITARRPRVSSRTDRARRRRRGRGGRSRGEDRLWASSHGDEGVVSSCVRSRDSGGGASNPVQLRQQRRTSTRIVYLRYV